FVIMPEGPTFVHVTEDPEKAWAEIGNYVLYEAQTYASIQTPGQTSAPKVDAKTIDDLKRSPQYLVATPDDVVAKVSTASAMAALVFNPLCGGMPPELGWPSPELFAAKVLPRRTDSTSGPWASPIRCTSSMRCGRATSSKRRRPAHSSTS